MALRLKLSSRVSLRQSRTLIVVSNLESETILALSLRRERDEFSLASTSPKREVLITCRQQRNSADFYENKLSEFSALYEDSA